MSLRPHGLAGAILDLPPDDRSVPDDGVGVELDDQIRGACSQELGRRNRCGRDCKINIEESNFSKRQSLRHNSGR